MSTEVLGNNEILGGLEELGLSNYEASAYFGLLGRGLITANDLAYCSSLPRTKIYSILKKLERKRLVFISNQKPLMFRALSPKDSFGDILEKYEKKVSGLRNLVERLQTINDDGLRNKGIEEKHYLVLNQSLTDNRIIELIKTSRDSIEITLNSWGHVLFSAVREQILKAVIRGVKVNVLFDTNSTVDSFVLPNAVYMKKTSIASNMFIFDKNIIILMNKDGNNSIYLDSVDILIPVLLRQFEDLWNKEKTIKVTNTKVESIEA